LNNETGSKECPKPNKMVYHRDQAQFERARWSLRVLLPLWAAQTLIFLALISIFGYRLSLTAANYDAEVKKGEKPLVLIM
jgi:hypothetical protein